MRTRPSLLYETCTRFDELAAIGLSRHQEKRRLRLLALRDGLPVPALAPSTGRIHSLKTLRDYKACALRFARWARATEGIARLAALDADAERLVALYLEARLAAGDSAATVKTVRSALRMFLRPAFPPEERERRVRALGAIPLPVRRREEITRSRHPVAMDDALAADLYLPLQAFAAATGLRRRELALLTAGSVRAEPDGRVVVDVWNGKGGQYRVVPVLPGTEDAVLAAVLDLRPDESVFRRIPVRLDVHALRRSYAQALYREGGLRPLPDPAGRLVPGSVDLERARYVARALGHHRTDVLVRHYLR